jgi:DNA-binding GntR family transcriptional regulator
VRPTLEGKHPARNEGADDIVRTNVRFLHQIIHEADNPVGLDVISLRIKAPIDLRGHRRIESRQVDKICLAGVLHIEKGLLPCPA